MVGGMIWFYIQITENNENVCTKHQRKHIRNVKLSMFSGNCNGEGLVISMDDKTYLRPETDGELIHANCRTNNFLITVMPLSPLVHTIIEGRKKSIVMKDSNPRG